MLEKNQYHLLDAFPFSHKHYSSHHRVAALADTLWCEIPIDKSRKSDLKQKCLTAVLVNLWLSMQATEYIAYARRKAYYAAIPARYRVAYNTYNIMCGVIDGLHEMGLVDSVKGFKNPEDGYGVLTKIKPTDDTIKLLHPVKPAMIHDQQPPELLIVKDRATKTKLDYADDQHTIEMRRQLLEYNQQRQSAAFTLPGVTEADEANHKRFFKLFGISGSEGNWTLRNPFMFRSFNDDFDHGGRYYNGIESQMPKAIRKKLHINGSTTVELDYGSMHIRMLYHLENKRIKGNVYDDLASGDPMLRQLYKLIALVSINSGSLGEALAAIRSELVSDKRELLEITPDITGPGLKVFYDRWLKAHSAIAKYFNSDIGVKLQYYDAVIASGIIKHFTDKSVPVLVVHDSFMIEDKYEAELKSIMIREYMKVMKHKPII
jgi:hypothetical protein